MQGCVKWVRNITIHHLSFKDLHSVKHEMINVPSKCQDGRIFNFFLTLSLGKCLRNIETGIVECQILLLLSKEFLRQELWLTLEKITWWCSVRKWTSKPYWWDTDVNFMRNDKVSTDVVLLVDINMESGDKRNTFVKWQTIWSCLSGEIVKPIKKMQATLISKLKIFKTIFTRNVLFTTNTCIQKCN